MSNREDSIKLLFRRYKDMRASAADLADWIALTSDIPDDDLKAAAFELVRTYTYNDPKPADLHATWQRMLNARKDNTVAAKQWANSVTKAMRREGRDWTPRFRDDITQEVIDTRNWKTLCNMDDTSLVWERKEFIKDYETIQAQRDTISKMSPAAKRLATNQPERKQLT